VSDRTRPFLCACLATLASGVACMFYQLAWVRKLTGVTTAATVAQVLVLAAFMAGLGIGAWLGGKLLHRITRPLLAYAVIEVAAACLFVIGIPFLAASLHVHQGLLDLDLSPGVALGGQLAVVSLYLVAATTLLGMTLPMLIAGLEYQPATEGLVKQEAVYNLIYGINTTGALAGCVIAGYVTIEYVGLDRSILLGVGCSLAAALGALAIGTSRAPAVRPEQPAGSAPVMSRRVLGVVFATGAIALAAEVVWVRMFSLVILNTVYAFTQVLAAVLLGIALAGIVTARIGRRLLRSDPTGKKLVRVAFCALLLAALWMSCVPWLTRQVAGTADFAGLAASGRSIKVVLMMAGILVPSSGLLALVLPLLISATVARDTTQVLAKLFAINTLGAVLGALAMGLWILPGLGLGAAQLMLAAAVVLTAALVPGRGVGRRGWLAIAGTGVLVGVLHLAVRLPQDLYALRFERNEVILELREGVTSDVLVSEDPAGHRRIWINSTWVAGTGGGHALLGHLPALSVAKLDRALGIALGTGQTFGAVLQHGARHLDCVEINPDVVELSRTWFAPFNHGLFDHPGVRVFLEDGRAFLRATRERYDLIVLEPLQAWSAGTTALYTREFYEAARRVLRDGGVLAQWIPFYGQDTAATQAMVRTAIEVFPQASLWLDEADGILLLHQGAFELPWAKLQREMRAPAYGALLDQKHLDPDDLLSLFLMGPRGLASWTRDADILEDDRPFLEYAAARHIGNASFTPTLASTLDHLEDPIAYLPGATFDTGGAVAARHAAITRQLCPPERLEACSAEIEADLSRVTDSERLRYQYRQLVLAWAETARSAPARREAILLRGIAHQPDFGEAMVNLAVSYAARGQREQAMTYALRAREIPRTRAGAERVLAKLRAARN
jgi:predicted membrane-bound spermidine synthase